MAKIIFLFLASVGIVCCIMILALFFSVCIDSVRNLIDRAKYKYRYKHRFDKPPTAKCYCYDCMWHNDISNSCDKFPGRHTADNWFCWQAEPRKPMYEKEVDNDTDGN